MIGQGRPSLSAIACAGLARGIGRRALLGRPRLLAFALCGLWTIACAAQEQPASEQVRLRLSWGGGSPSHWYGHFGLDKGSFSDLKLLGLAADEAGSIWLENGEVHIATLSPRQEDAVEVATAADQNSKLFIKLSNSAAQPQPPTPVAIADLVKQPFVLRLDDRGNTLKVEHIQNDRLRIVTDRDQLIFSPGEQFAFELSAVLEEVVPGTTLDIRTTLSPGRSDETVWSSEQRMEVPVEGRPRTRLSIPLPRSEGAYTVRLAAMRPSGFRERFFPGAAPPLAERSFDVVVVESRRKPATQPAEWDTVLEIDPSSPRWWERLPAWTQLRRIPGLNRGPLGSIRAGAVYRPLGRFVELPPTIPGMDPHWQAYSLPLEAVGVPHLLEIEYPGDEEQHFSISIVEPNAAGVIEGIGRDGGVYVEGFGLGESKSPQTHRTVFWPRTQAPLLLVTNAHPTAATYFGDIRVRKLRSGELAGGLRDPSPDDRLVAAYMARPLIPEAFGASDILDLSNRATASGSVNDWQTFYESAVRLADYLRYGGYNSAVISVLADGAAIYASTKLRPTPQHNTGREIGEIAERDALELLLRVFDREGLRLVPALQFAAPIPELEALRRGSDPQTSGLEWIGPDGQTWLATRGATDGLAPYYNLLDPRVQHAILDLVHELVKRYDSHPSFAGLAIQLSSRGYAQLPPLEWGLDDATVERFQRDTGIQLAGTGPGRFAARHAQLTGEHAAAWAAWRAAAVTALYDQIAKVVRQTRSERRLLLTLEESFADPQLAARVRPDLIGENRVDKALFDLGIDRELLKKVPGLVICPPRYVESMVPLPDRAADLEINQAAAAWHRNSDSSSTAAALFFHRPQRRRLASFHLKSPINVTGDLLLVPQSLAHGTAVRQPYVEFLVDADPAIILDGGELLPFGQEATLRKVRSILCRLPKSAEVANHAAQPVFVRSYSEANRTTLLVVNASPWHAEAEIALNVSQATSLRPLTTADAGNASLQARPLAAGTQPWPLSLEPYAVEAVEIEAPGVTVANLRADISDEGKAELAARLTGLTNRDFTAPHLYSALTNPSFEPLGGAGPLPGWRVSGNGATAELDATSPQDGKTCLYFQSSGPVAILESDDFPTPPTGQLAMTVYARCQRSDPPTELRMVFEAERAGQAYRRSVIVGGTQPDAPHLDVEWRRPYAILVNDLPLDSQGRMRVRFELSGPAEVWLDNIQLYDLLFPLKWCQEAKPAIKQEIKQFFILIHAIQRAVEAGRVADSVRLLQGYWPRFITAYTPQVQPQIAVEAAPKTEVKSTPPANQDEQPAPSFSERIKRLMPLMR